MKKKFFHILLLLLPLLSIAQAGSLDTGFGINGKSLVCFNENSLGNSSCLQSDGKIIIAGYKDPQNGFVSRINAYGSLDTTFGVNGIRELTYGSWVYGVAIQSDGKSIAVGNIPTIMGDKNMIISRLDTNGNFDAAFGTNGIVVLDLNTFYDYAFAVKVQTNGKIIIGGSSGSVNGGFTLVRLNTDGTLDTGFGNGGKVVTVFASGNESQINSLEIQADGRIIAGGTRVDGTKNFAVSRYNSDGSLDASFGINGKVVTIISPGISDELESIKILSDGKIIVQGNTNIYGSVSQTGIALVRYNSNGTIDNSFGLNGISIVTGCNGYDLAIQADGKPVVAGVENGAFLTVRYTADGNLDASFNGNGKVSTVFNTPCFGFSILIQPDNKIVVSGFSENNDGSRGCLAILRMNAGTLGLEEFTTATIKVYPNPTKDKVFFDNGSYAFTTVGVYNYLGQEVLRKSVSAMAHQEVDLSGFSNGVYLLKLEGENGDGLVKVVKK